MQSDGTIEEDNYILSNLQAISSDLIDMRPLNGDTIMDYTPIEFYIAWEDPNPNKPVGTELIRRIIDNDYVCTILVAYGGEGSITDPIYFEDA